MTFAKFAFLVIDKIFAGAQNPKKLLAQFADVKKEADIVFDEKYPDVKLDAYFPANTEGKPLPVIMEIHGGGFSAGDKKYRTALSSYYAKETGAAVFSVNYGLGGKVICPVPLQQLVSAANWINANAAKYNLDMTHFVASGDSAGGYYAGMLGVLQDSTALQELYEAKLDARFTGLVLNCGIYDIKKALQAKVLFNMTAGVCKDFAGIAPKELDTYKYKDGVSSIDYVTDKYPKSYVIYAEQDFFCGGQGEALIAKLNELGVYEEHYGSTAFGDNHTFSLTWTSKAAQEANEKMVDFLRRFFADKI